MTPEVVIHFIPPFVQFMKYMPKLGFIIIQILCLSARFAKPYQVLTGPLILYGIVGVSHYRQLLPGISVYYGLRDHWKGMSFDLCKVGMCSIIKLAYLISLMHAYKF